MTTSIQINGISTEIMEKMDVQNEMMTHMDLYFETHFRKFIMDRWHVELEELDEIIKNKYPEKFV